MADKIINEVLGRDALPVPETMVDQGDTTYARKVAPAGGTAPASVTLPAYTTLQNAVAASANGATLDVSGKNVVIFDVAGTFVGTVSFETLQADGTTWVALNALQIGTGLVGPTTTVPGLYRASVDGLDTVRARVTWTSGTSVTVKARALLIEDTLRPVTGAGGGLYTQTNVKRGTEVLHRDAITAIDCLSVPGTLTLSAITEAGSNLTNAAHHVLVSAGNAWGPTGPGADPGAITPTANQAIRVAFAQVVGADYYDLFIGTPTIPLWVGRVTEAQRATGDRIISAVGTVSARAGATVGGTVDLGIVGTGLATTVAPFATNTAFTPASVTPLSLVGWQGSYISAKLSVTDLRSLPAFTLRCFRQSTLDTTVWFQVGLTLNQVPLASATAVPLEFEFNFNPNGPATYVVLVTALAGQGAALSIWICGE